MTSLEQAVNRARMRAGYLGDWTEETGVRDLPNGEGEVVSGAVIKHVNNTDFARRAANAGERALAAFRERNKL